MVIAARVCMGFFNSTGGVCSAYVADVCNEKVCYEIAAAHYAKSAEW